MVAGVRKSDAIRGEAPVARQTRRPSLWPRLSIGCAALAVVSVVALAMGPADVSLEATVRILASHLPGVGIPEDISPAWRNIIWEVRLPRVLLAGAVGATLVGRAFAGLGRRQRADGERRGGESVDARVELHGVLLS